MENETKKNKVRVIDSLWTFLVATAVLGPFALPLLWRNPRFKKSTKILGSIAVIAFTYFLLKFFTSFMDSQLKELGDLQELMKGM